jgi:hypothetical protein
MKVRWLQQGTAENEGDRKKRYCGDSGQYPTVACLAARSILIGVEKNVVRQVAGRHERARFAIRLAGSRRQVTFTAQNFRTEQGLVLLAFDLEYVGMYKAVSRESQRRHAEPPQDSGKSLSQDEPLVCRHGRSRAAPWPAAASATTALPSSGRSFGKVV